MHWHRSTEIISDLKASLQAFTHFCLHFKIDLSPAWKRRHWGQFSDAKRWLKELVFMQLCTNTGAQISTQSRAFSYLQPELERWTILPLKPQRLALERKLTFWVVALARSCSLAPKILLQLCADNFCIFLTNRFTSIKMTQLFWVWIKLTSHFDQF